jgi:hypothetical protein
MSSNSFNKKSLKDIKKNLKQLVEDIEAGNLKGEESKYSSNPDYYASKYFKP